MSSVEERMSQINDFFFQIHYQMSSDTTFLLIGLLTILYYLKHRKRRYLRREKHNRIPRRTLPFYDAVYNYETDEEFRRSYRMSKAAFRKLVGILEPKLRRCRCRPHSRSTKEYHISAVNKVSITLRWLAGGAMIDIYKHHGFERMTCYKVVDEVVNAILATPEIVPCHFKPRDKDWLKSKGDLFASERPNHPFANYCVGAIDGLAIKIGQPRGHFINSTDYRNRKGFFGICCQGLCDAQRRFLFFSASAPGSTHDSLAFSYSDLFEVLVLEKLPNNYFIAADDAYPLLTSLLKPFGKKNLSVWKDSFNYHLSNMRVVIENAFGVFVRRWGIFWRRLDLTPQKVSKLIICCVHLHNFIIDEDGPQSNHPFPNQRRSEEATVHLQDQVVEDNARQWDGQTPKDGKTHRQYFTSLLQSVGRMRPTLIQK
jgi:hypothetical protein